MTTKIQSLQAQLTTLIGAPNVISEGDSLETLSKDFYWYSPVLTRQLKDKRAELIARPGTVDELRSVIIACFDAKVPVTPRGAGTGNYGQAVPLHGGVVIDLARLDRILDISDDGVLRCEPGARLGVIEPQVRAKDWELRCLPSTWVKSSMGGFFSGGSGGIGGITWGGIATPGNVKSVTVMTCEAEPRLLRFEETDSTRALHTYGTTGILVEIEMRLAPRVTWEQLAFTSTDWNRLTDWTESIARDGETRKRLVTQLEHPLPSYFKPLVKYFQEGEHATFLFVELERAEAVIASAEAAGLRLATRMAFSEPPKPPYLTDYTWNHTTLWAIKADPVHTYLQVGYGKNFREQIDALRNRFPGEIFQHIEWTAGGHKVVDAATRRVVGDNIGLGAIPVIRFTTEERLNEIIAACEELGVGVANPHTYKLEGGGRHPNIAAKRELKADVDPAGLLNPGKMSTYPVNPFAETAV